MNRQPITNNAQRSPFEAQLIERMERTNPWARPGTAGVGGTARHGGARWGKAGQGMAGNDEL